MADADDLLAERARDFLRAAFAVLVEQHVLPRPRFHPYLQVGRDYFGTDLMPLQEFVSLEEAINQRHPRFSEETPLMNRDFANGYIFSFLEASVARIARSGRELRPDVPEVNECIAALAAEVDAERWEVACCREVCHLTTSDGQPLGIGGLVVFPITAEAAGHSREAARIIDSVIPNGLSAFDRDAPGGWAPPQSIVVAKEESGKLFEAGRLLSGRIEQFLLVSRLLHAGTCQSLYEVQGETSPVRRFDPILEHFRGSGVGLASGTQMVRRTVRLGEADVAAYDGLLAALRLANPPRENMVRTSFTVALHKFQSSYHAYRWDEQVVDLATAFEAALSGTAKNEVLLRLRTRSAALLATDRDPAGAVFRDVGLLYDLRSTLVHGGDLPEKKLRKTVTAISTVPDDAMFGVAIGHAVDRLRDLVRRSLLARICLSHGSDPLWALDDDAGVDEQLADDDTRRRWRAAWRDVLGSFGAASAADRPRAAADYISPHDR